MFFLHTWPMKVSVSESSGGSVGGSQEKSFSAIFQSCQNIFQIFQIFQSFSKNQQWDGCSLEWLLWENSSEFKAWALLLTGTCKLSFWVWLGGKCPTEWKHPLWENSIEWSGKARPRFGGHNCLKRNQPPTHTVPAIFHKKWKRASLKECIWSRADPDPSHAYCNIFYEICERSERMWTNILFYVK